MPFGRARNKLLGALWASEGTISAPSSYAGNAEHEHLDASIAMRPKLVKSQQIRPSDLCIRICFLRRGGSVCRVGGVFAVFSEGGKQRLGSAENPSVSLRDPPSLGKGRSFLPLTSRPATSVYGYGQDGGSVQWMSLRRDRLIASVIISV